MTTRQQTILRIGIIGGALLLILVVVIVVRNVSIVKKSASEVEQRNRMLQMVNGSLSVCDDDPYPGVCRTRLVNKQAREFKSSEMCEVLDGEERVSCVNAVIRETLDSNDCSVLKGGEKDSCRDHVIRLAAQDKLDLALCIGIGDDVEKVQCEEIVTKMIVDSGKCTELGVDPSICETNEIIEKAAAGKDSSRCNDLQGDDVQRCLDEVDAQIQNDDFFTDNEPEPVIEVDPLLDSDLDGITDEDEKNIYGTDPFNPDSDNDGYSDKVEIDGGFNPLGTG